MLVKDVISKSRVISRHTNLHHYQTLVHVDLGMWVELRFQEQYVGKHIAEANNVCNDQFTIKLSGRGEVLVTLKHPRIVGGYCSSGASADGYGENIHKYS